MGDTRVVPRAAIDLAYPPGGNVHVTATQASREETGSLTLGTITTGRFFFDLGFENDVAMACDGKGPWDNIDGQFRFEPGLFCGFRSGGLDACGIGLDLDNTGPKIRVLHKIRCI